MLATPPDLAARLRRGMHGDEPIGAKRAGDGAAEAPDGGDAVLARLAAEALTEIGAISEGDSETRAMAACTVARRFQERAWDATLASRPAALAAAAAELEELRSLYSEAEFTRACEEAARDALRQRFPALTATRIWAEFGVGD